ncbi:extracellular solute-binding protein [Leifsonia poae]|uniref:extracellular solute-binding protein n=1 Tax=Leifsonia poae TaxID=110933 RepID=UPI003D670DE3
MTLTSRFGRTPRRRLLAAAAIVAATGIALAGCSASGSGSGDDVKKLTLWVSSSAAQQKGFDQLATDYNAKTGVEVNVVNIPYSGYSAKLHNAAQANALPDVADVPAIDPIWKNKIVDLSSIAADKANNINQSYVAKDAKGKALAIPSDVTSTGLFINKSLWEKAGVTFPTSPDKTWTWTEFVSAANKVRESTGAKYSLVYDASPSRLRAMVYEMGGKYMQAGSDGNFSADSATKKAVDYFVGLNDDTTMPKSVWTSGADPSALFQSGQVAAYWSGVWQVSAFAESITSFDWASVPTPAQPVQAADVNAGGLMVGFQNSDAKGKAAKDFLSWMYEPAQYKKLAETNGYLPVETGLDVKYSFTSQAAQDAFTLYNKEIALYKPVSGYFLQAQTGWALSGKSLTTDPTVTELGKAINGQQSSADALKNIVDGYNKQVGK